MCNGPILELNNTLKWEEKMGETCFNLSGIEWIEKKSETKWKKSLANKSVVKLTRLHQPSKIIDSVTTK